MRGLLLAAGIILGATVCASPAQAAPPVPAEVRWRLPALEFSAGAATALVTVPVTLSFAAWVGSGASDLYLALIPVGLLAWVVPPLLTAWVEWRLGQSLEPGSTRFLRAFLPALGVNGISLFLGMLARVWVGNVGALVAFSFIQALVLPAAATASLSWSRLSPPEHTPPNLAALGFAPTCTVFSF